MSDEVKPLPCRICGAVPRTLQPGAVAPRSAAMVICSGDLSHTMSIKRPTLEAAIAAWNTRPSTPLQPSEGKVQEAVERLRKAAAKATVYATVQIGDLSALLAEMDKLAAAGKVAVAEMDKHFRRAKEEYARAEAAEANLSSEAKAHEVTKGKLARLGEADLSKLRRLVERQRPGSGHCGESTSDIIDRQRQDDWVDRILAALDQPGPSVEGAKADALADLQWVAGARAGYRVGYRDGCRPDGCLREPGEETLESLIEGRRSAALTVVASVEGERT